jgi:hypothetical protein
VGEMRNAHSVLIGHFGMKTPFVRTTCARKYNIKAVLK